MEREAHYDGSYCCKVGIVDIESVFHHLPNRIDHLNFVFHLVIRFVAALSLKALCIQIFDFDFILYS